MSKLYDTAATILADRARFAESVKFTPAGRTKEYLTDAAMNLLSGLTLEDIRADLEAGDGGELKGKFRAPHSSSALAVNTFARFRKEGVAPTIGRHTDVAISAFERKCHHGLSSERAPNLDVVAEGDGILGVESKFMEYLKPKPAKFSRIYADEMPPARRGAFYNHMIELLDRPTAYRRLDAAQLIKHAYGLAHTYPGRKITLLYLYWEPENASAHDLFAEHRTEIATFAARVAGDVVSFDALSYPELWNVWDKLDTPDWLPDHLHNLRKRYAVTIPA